MIASQSAAQAKAYFTDALSKSDYYIGDQELNGTFRGLLSERLNIRGIATKERFFALCENRHPESGEALTPRTKKERTVGYDINFHVPKSVSILHAFAGDNHILDAFQASVNETMAEIEKGMRTRVRKEGVYGDRLTEEFLYVDFIHQTARPVEGHLPDPHLHAHCYVFNMTWDEREKRLKAGQFRQVNQDMPFYQALFHKKFSDKLMTLGYQVRPTAKSFEVVGVAPDLISMFSKRTDEIGRIAKDKGITGAKELAELGARTRSKKLKGLSMEELKSGWASQIRESTSDGKSILDGENIKQLRNPLRSKQFLVDHTANDSRDFAVKHCFERASVTPFNKLAQTALKHNIGSRSNADDVINALKTHEDIIKVNERGRDLCTTKEVLAEEERMVEMARRGRNRFAPLYTVVPSIKSSGQQGDAIRHILTTTDMVSIVRGAAGAGKTTLMKEAVPLIEKTGKKVTIVAPSSNASRRNLRKEGFDQAETVATLLIDPKRQAELRNGVLWVDEAGMLGTSDMSALLEMATKHNSRLILGGDTRQHASVDRGDALRILNVVAGISTAEVNQIHRQRDALYASAVKDLSSGDILDGFMKLDTLGAFYEAPKANATEQLVKDYVSAIRQGKNAMIISPTHNHGDEVTERLRGELRLAGLIGRKEIIIDRFKALTFTEAEKTDWRKYAKGMVMQFNQNRPGIKRGSVWTVDDGAQGAVTIRNTKNDVKQLDLTKPSDFSLFEAIPLALSKGDKVQVTKNGFDKHKTRLDNGTMLTILSVSKSGEIVAQASGGKTTFALDKQFGHLAHAHCVTSHKSQGSTVDEIFISQPSETFAATNAKQFYVSVSRARDNVRIYTDDKDQLLKKASDEGNRRGAMELVNSVNGHIEMDIRTRQADRPQPITGKTIQQDKPTILPKYDSYEPEL